MELVSSVFVIWALKNKVEVMNGFEMLDFQATMQQVTNTISNKI